MNIKRHLLILSAALTLASCGGNSSSSATDASKEGGKDTSGVVSSVEESSSEEAKNTKVAKSLHAALQSYPEKSGIGLDATLNLGVQVNNFGSINLSNLKLVAEGFHDKTEEPVVVVPATETEAAKTMNYFKAHLGLGFDSLVVETTVPNEATSDESASSSEGGMNVSLSNFGIDAYLDGDMVYANTEKLQLDKIGEVISTFSPESEIVNVLSMVGTMLGVFNNKICTSLPNVQLMLSAIGGGADAEASVSFDPQALVDGYDSAMNAIKSIDVDQVESVITLLEDHVSFDAEGNGYKATLNTTYDNVYFFLSLLGNTAVEGLKGFKLDDLKNNLPNLDETGAITCTFDNNGISNLSFKLATGVAIGHSSTTETSTEVTYAEVGTVNLNLNINLRDCLSLELPDFSDYKDPFPKPEEETSASVEESTGVEEESHGVK